MESRCETGPRPGGRQPSTAAHRSDGRRGCGLERVAAVLDAQSHLRPGRTASGRWTKRASPARSNTRPGPPSSSASRTPSTRMGAQGSPTQRVSPCWGRSGTTRRAASVPSVASSVVVTSKATPERSLSMPRTSSTSTCATTSVWSQAGLGTGVTNEDSAVDRGLGWKRAVDDFPWTRPVVGTTDPRHAARVGEGSSRKDPATEFPDSRLAAFASGSGRESPRADRRVPWWGRTMLPGGGLK